MTDDNTTPANEEVRKFYAMVEGADKPIPELLERFDRWLAAHDKEQASRYPVVNITFANGAVLSDEDIDRLAWEVLKARQAADGFDLAAHDKEVLDRAAERAAECITNLVFANSTDDAVVTVFTDYGPDVAAAVRGEGESND